MNLRQLEIFETVMKTRSVSEAARALNVSQPAITKSVRQTEQAVGFVLFRRARGRLYPSPEAEALLPQAHRIRAEVGVAANLCRQLREGHAGRVTVAAASGVGHAFVTPALGRFAQEHPGIHVEVMLLATVDVAERVARSEADFGLVHEPTDNPHVAGEVICQAEAACFMPRAHLLARRKAISAKDLAGEHVICYREDTAIGGLVRNALRAGGAGEVAIVVNQSLQALELVERGAGIAVIDPFLQAVRSRPALAAVPFRPAIACRLRLIRARERPRSRAATQLERAVRERVQAYAAENAAGA